MSAKNWLLYLALAGLGLWPAGCQMAPSPVAPTMAVVTHIPGPQDLTDAAQNPGPVSGRVVDEAGNPVANARVLPEIHTPNVPLATIGYRTNAEGYYRLGLRPADYTVTIIAEGYYSETKAITVAEGAHETLDFVLRPVTSIPGPPDLTDAAANPGPVSGWVVDEAGKPVAGAFVVPEIHTPNVPLNTAAYYTDAKGYYRLNLRPADYTVTIIAEGYYSETKAITVAEGAHETLDFVLRPIK